MPKRSKMHIRASILPSKKHPSFHSNIPRSTILARMNSHSAKRQTLIEDSPSPKSSVHSKIPSQKYLRIPSIHPYPRPLRKSKHRNRFWYKRKNTDSLVKKSKLKMEKYRNILSKPMQKRYRKLIVEQEAR
mmetsp:Transcript_37007/g.36606  ORF Transcript_37007/g.36606 Transcript_37007/m.36606 type:complete len:131 (-) Transcript_37007:47-439(-)